MSLFSDYAERAEIEDRARVERMRAAGASWYTVAMMLTMDQQAGTFGGLAGDAWSTFQRVSANLVKWYGESARPVEPKS